MFSSDVAKVTFFEANRQQQNYSRVVHPLYGAYSEWQQCFFLQAGPGCIHGEAALSYLKQLYSNTGKDCTRRS